MVSAMFMTEAHGYAGSLPTDREPLTDLAGVMLGFGVLLCNGSHLYHKGCGGVRIMSATKMPTAELAIALAIYCHLHDVAARPVAKHLESTPRAHFDEAVEWAAANASVLRSLRERPELFADDGVKLAPARGWLSGLLAKWRKRSEVAPDDDPDAIERQLRAADFVRRSAKPLSPEQSQRMAELRKLVDESLDA
jgi:hypothetical protein